MDSKGIPIEVTELEDLNNSTLLNMRERINNELGKRLVDILSSCSIKNLPFQDRQNFFSHLENSDLDMIVEADCQFSRLAKNELLARRHHHRFRNPNRRIKLRGWE